MAKGFPSGQAKRATMTPSDEDDPSARRLKMGCEADEVRVVYGVLESQIEIRLDLRESDAALCPSSRVILIDMKCLSDESCWDLP